MHKVTTAAVVGVLLVPAATSTAAFAAASDPSVIATFDGHTIDLADGWQTAHACVVLGTGSVQCYDTEADMRDALAASAVQPSVRSATSPNITCSSPSNLVTLYASTNFSGNSLSFVSTGGWTNLAPYGFDNKMESWVNQTPCNATVADGTGGTGAQLTLAARSSAATVGTSWKDRASSINVLP
jgi:hypothetical protein